MIAASQINATNSGLCPHAPWFLVHTYSGREQVAVTNLERQGISTFLPTSLKSIRHGRRTKTIETAYFPAYLFVTFDWLNDPWRSINYTFGVRRLVSFNDRPAQVPPDIMAHLLSRSSDDGLMLAPPALVPGDNVRITVGPFAGHLATIDTLTSDQRVRLLINLMEHAIPIEIARHHLEVAHGI